MEQQRHQDVTIKIGKDIAIDNLQPVHLVTYACLIHALKAQGYRVFQDRDSTPCDNYVYNDLGFRHYWHDDVNHVDTARQNIFNLWRIKEGEMDLYAKRVEDYLKNKLFEGKYLSLVSSCLTETFYNIFDHADAHNNAYFFMKYNEKRKLLHVAVCDFGKGIVKSVRDFTSSNMDDREALERAAENNFTTQSTDHNKGKGLDNIISQTLTLHILSGKAMLYKSATLRQTYDLDFDFQGTLVYFDVDLNNLESDEVLTEFSF